MEMLREMAIFAQVVDSGGFSAAARQLDLTTSAVSRHVSRLEAQLGGRLLQRTTRSLALTELGGQVHVACARMLAAAREVNLLAGSYSARPNGIIRVMAPVVFGQVWLAPKLPGFLELYPEVDVRLTLVDRTVDLIEDGADLAIRIARELAPGLAARPLCSIGYVLVASSDYLATYSALDMPQQLAEHRCSHLDYGPFCGAWTLQRDDAKVAVTVRARVTINNSGAILAMVAAGGGSVWCRTLRRAPRWRNAGCCTSCPSGSCEPYAGAVHAV